MVHGSGVLLLATVAGYWLLERAETHKGQLRSVGRFLGWLIIVTSLLGVACRVWALSTGTGGWCPVGSGKGFGGLCPFMSKSSSPVKP